ncbi:TlpA disulfide reductase family protein [Sphaerobacter sp.]|uniref:TlpA family protein disulfide reductase n=1 Tax=Sphaerobacter sp. TaxID=2099654 RepID=UPI001D313EEA|nr:TlpA disulfide reductase family protein [Sphaerobacter sp.]MBX5444813.1 TlpA family protein disulfide reductase [Sphaerobacter sp.]
MQADSNANRGSHIPDSTAAATTAPDKSHAGLSTVPLLSLAVVVLLITGFLVYTFGFAGNSNGVVETGKKAPNFELPGLNGETIRLSDYRGQVVLVNFWATWCKPCQVEMPEFQAIYEKYRNDGFTILGVNQAEPPELVRPYVEKGGYSWTFALDEKGKISERYGVYGIPQSYLIDRDGKVVYMWLGIATQDSVESQLAKLGIGA